MADEILVLEGDRSERYGLLMLFPLDGQGGNPSPVQAGGANVVPSPVPKEEDGTTPAWPFGLLTQQERDGLDGGALAYRVVRMRKETGLTNPQLVARVQAIYAKQHSDFNDQYATRYAHIGTRVDAS